MLNKLGRPSSNCEFDLDLLVEFDSKKQAHDLYDQASNDRQHVIGNGFIPSLSKVDLTMNIMLKKPFSKHYLKEIDLQLDEALVPWFST